MLFRFTLTHTSGSTTLTTDPEGWDKSQLILRRDPAFHGIFTEHTVKLGFFCNGGGREFIETIYDSVGIDTTIEILIEIDCNQSGTYEEFFDGILNLASLEWDKTFIRANIEQAGIAQTVKNRADIKIDLTSLTSLDGTALAAMTYAPYDLTLHSKAIFAESELNDDLSEQFDWSMTPDEPARRLFMQVPYAMVKDELELTIDNPVYFKDGATGETIGVQTSSPFHDSSTQSPQLVPGTYNVSYDFSGTYKDNVPNGNTRTVGDIKLWLLYGTALPLNTPHLIGTIAGYTENVNALHTETFNFVNTTTIAMTPDSKIWLMWTIDSYDITNGTAGIEYDVETTFDHSGGGDTAQLIIDITSVLGASTAKAFAIHEAFARISQSITDQADAFRSSYFGRKNSQPNTYPANGCGSFTAITTGHLIRQLNPINLPTAVSLNDLFNAMDGIWNLGLGVEEGGTEYVIRVEKKNYFYDTTVLFQVPNVFYKTEVSEERYINEVDIGYSTWLVEEINALDEFNVKHEYATLLKAVKNKVDAVCSFIAGGYAIEVTRRLRRKGTTDWRYDENNFVICLNRSVDGGGSPNNLATAEKNENYTSTSGLLSPSTVYNLRISPKRNLLRWVYMIGAGLLKDAGSLIKFTAGAANSDISSRLIDTNCPGDFNNVSIDEDDDVAWDNANLEDGDVVWIPEIFTFEAPMTWEEYKLARANPTRAIEFSETSSGFTKAFILELAYSPIGGMATFKLLASN